MHLVSGGLIPQNRLQHVTRLPAWRLSASCLSHTQTPSPLQESPSWWVVTRSLLKRRSLTLLVPSRDHILQNHHITAPWWLSPLWSHLLRVLRPITPTNMMDASDLSAKQLLRWKDVNWRERVCCYCCRGATENMGYTYNTDYTPEYCPDTPDSQWKCRDKMSVVKGGSCMQNRKQFAHERRWCIWDLSFLTVYKPDVYKSLFVSHSRSNYACYFEGQSKRDQNQSNAPGKKKKHPREASTSFDWSL